MFLPLIDLLLFIAIFYSSLPRIVSSYWHFWRGHFSFSDSESTVRQCNYESEFGFCWITESCCRCLTFKFSDKEIHVLFPPSVFSQSAKPSCVKTPTFPAQLGPRLSGQVKDQSHSQPHPAPPNPTSPTGAKMATDGAPRLSLPLLLPVTTLLLALLLTSAHALCKHQDMNPLYTSLMTSQGSHAAVSFEGGGGASFISVTLVANRQLLQMWRMDTLFLPQMWQWHHKVESQVLL